MIVSSNFEAPVIKNQIKKESPKKESPKKESPKKESPKKRITHILESKIFFSQNH